MNDESDSIVVEKDEDVSDDAKSEFMKESEEKTRNNDGSDGSASNPETRIHDQRSGIDTSESPSTGVSDSNDKDVSAENEPSVSRSPRTREFDSPPSDQRRLSEQQQGEEGTLQKQWKELMEKRRRKHEEQVLLPVNQVNHYPDPSMEQEIMDRIQRLDVSLDFADDFVRDILTRHYNITSLAGLMEYYDRKQSESSGSHAHGRRLGDTYRESLITTNLLLTKLFGMGNRKVPAHMPHLINKYIMSELEMKLPVKFNETIRHKFRDGSDLQYAFLYFHYLFSKSKLDAVRNIEYVWETIIDTDGNGVLNANEFDTLCHIVFDRDVTLSYKKDLLQCISPHWNISHIEWISKGSVWSGEAAHFNITLNDIRKCDRVVNSLVGRFDAPVKMQMDNDVQVAFQMTDDNYENTLRQLDSVRMRKSKFVCINDDIHNPTPELDKAIRDFYESFFPLPSQFEKNWRYERLKIRVKQWIPLVHGWSIVHSDDIFKSIIFFLCAALIITIIFSDSKSSSSKDKKNKNEKSKQPVSCEKND